MGTVVVAFGGNALQPPDGNAIDSPVDLHSAACAMADLVEDGHRLVITHGNGPQVGYGLIRNAWAPGEVPRLSMASLVAQSQGELGNLLSLALRNAFANRHITNSVVALVTQVVIELSDPALATFSKPVGPVVDDAEAAQRLSERTGLPLMAERGGHRMAVPSPWPRKILDSHSIGQLLDTGAVVIAGGGGGIPVAYDPDGQLVPMTGVIDKDRTSAALAIALDADVLVFLTDVAGVYRDFGTPQRSLIKEGDWSDFDAMARDLTSGVGSMQPKLAAACDFVQTTKHAAAIGNLQQASLVVNGIAGTRIVWREKEGREIAHQ